MKEVAFAKIAYEGATGAAVLVVTPSGEVP